MSLLALTLLTPLLVKVNHTGFVPPAWARSERCEVFQTEIALTRTYGHEAFQYNFPYSAAEDSLDNLIEKARHEQLSLKDNYLCDGPSTTITVGEDFLIYSTGGCGSPRKIRQGPYSSALMDIASTFCPTTH